MKQVRQNQAVKAILYSAGAGLPAPIKQAELVCTFELRFQKVSTPPQGKKNIYIYQINFPGKQKLD